jgi:tetratricopeptide (TPR) repeat protein
MSRTSLWSRLLLALMMLALAGSVAAEAVIKPLPPGDVSRLPADVQQELSTSRREFEQNRVNLVGQELADSFARLGALYLRYGVFDVAHAAFTNAAGLIPEDGRYSYLLGVVSEQSNHLPDARAYYTAAVKLDPDYLPIRYRLTNVQIQLNDLAGARQAISEVAQKRPELGPPHAALGEIALREKRYPEAISQLQLALKSDPQATALYKSLAQALEASGDRTGAAAAKAKIGEQLMAYPDPLVQNIYMPTGNPIENALAAASLGDMTQARAYLDAVLKAQPNNVDAVAAYARVEADSGNLPAARSRAEAALKIDPKSATANLAQGAVLEVSGQEAQAVPFYEKAVQADLKLAEARVFLGNVYLRRQNYAAAAEQYRQLAAIDPGNASGFARLAVAQAKAGHCADALHEVNAALKQRPKDGRLMQTFVRLASSCGTASPEERRMAADYGLALYKQRPDVANSEALAMAMAAIGKTKDAVDFEAQAMFEALRVNDQAAVAWMKPLLERFKAGQVATQPWPAGHPFVAPPTLTSRKPQAPAPAAASATPRQ